MCPNDLGRKVDRPQFSSVAQLCPTLCHPMNQHARPPCPSPTPGVHSNSRPSLFLLPPIPPSIRVFSNESTLRMRWPTYWSVSFSISPSKEIPGLISFRVDWLDLLSVQGTLKSLLQHHSSKVSILQCSAFFIIQLSHPYMTTGKTIALTIFSSIAVLKTILVYIMPCACRGHVNLINY